MKIKNMSMSYNQDNASAYMSCATDEVNVDFRFNHYKGNGSGSREFTAEQKATIGGRNVTSVDRYDMNGTRLTEAQVWESVFTQEYYNELDAMALEFASIAQDAVDKHGRYFPSTATASSTI